MGRPPSNGGPAFRFNSAEVLEMEAILQDHDNMMPVQEVLVNLADKFSNSPERQGKFVVQTKQIWNWFQNKRYAIRARTTKIPTVSNVSSTQSMSTGVPMQAVSAPAPAPVISTITAVQAKPAIAPSSAQVISKEDELSASRLPNSVADAPGRTSADSSQMEFEARSARDGAWYDVASFLSLRNLEAGLPDVLVRFAGFGPEEDEWINVTTHVRHRSLPCESSECVAVLPGDLILCFQEGKEQALYYDAHVLDAQRRRHDARGCRCRFLVRYDHDQSEEIVPLRKICRRPETDYRLQQLHAMNETSAEQRKFASSVNYMKSAPAEEQTKISSSVEEINTGVDPSYSKAAFSNSATLSEQTPPALVSLVNPSSVSSDKTGVNINAASSNVQPSHPEVINLDPETEVENKSHEIKDTFANMDVDVPLEKVTDTTPKSEVDATDFTITQNVTGELVNQTPLVVETEHDSNAGQVVPDNQASLVVETEHALNAGGIGPDKQDLTVGIEHSLNAGQIDLDNQDPPVVETEQSLDDGQVDLEPMIVETNCTVDERKTDTEHAEDLPNASTDPNPIQEAGLPFSSPPANAGVNECRVDVPEMASNVGDGTLEHSGATTTEAGKTDIDSGYSNLVGAIDNADHPVDDSGPSNSSTINVNAEDRNGESMTQAVEDIQ